MKRAAVRSLLLVGVVSVLAFLGSSGVAAESVKPGESVHVYDDPAWAAQHGKVVFSHDEHRELFGQEKLDCQPCHMTQPPLFPMRRKPDEPRKAVTMAEMAQGQSCGACHNGKTEMNGKVAASVADVKACGDCHKK